MPRARLIAVIATGTALLAVLLWAMLAPAPGPRTSQAGPAATLTEPVLIRYDSTGRPLWELRAKSLVLQDTQVTKGREIKLRFFAAAKQDGSGAEPALTVEAAALTLYNRSGDLELSGGVTARAADLVFATERMRWDAQHETLSGAGTITAHTRDSRLRGRGFRYSLQTGRLTVEHDAELTFSARPETDNKPGR